MRRPISRLLCSASVLLLVAVQGMGVPSPAPDKSLDAAKKSIASGLAFLRKTQEANGSWGDYPGTTALALCAFLQNGYSESKDPAVAKGIAYLVKAVKPDGGIYSDSNPTLALPNYNTSVCLMAFSQTKNPAYNTIIRNAQKLLDKLQFAEGNGVPAGDARYGGFGYGNTTGRPDLSNGQMALEGLKQSKLPATAPVWKKAIVFLQHVQNSKEVNTQPWAKEGINDGGFVYDINGRTFSPPIDGKPTSYGAMTYAGARSYLYCGVSKTDPRVVAAVNWIKAHYSVTEHPGMGQTSLYYYYVTMAQALAVYGQKTITDSAGKSHNWSQEMAGHIPTLQRPDGSWANMVSAHWEDRPVLATSYALIALSYCTR